jgi:stage V sporulation protein SpoVS
MGAPLTPPLIEPEQGARRGQFDVIRGDSGILLRVKHTTDIKLLAASISFALVGNQRVTLRAVGAPAVNALLKSAAVARQYVAVRGPGSLRAAGLRDADAPEPPARRQAR